MFKAMLINKDKPPHFFNIHNPYALLGIFLLSILLLTVTGCSSPQPRYQARIPSTPLPEISRPQVNRTAPVRASNPKKPVATVQRYSDKPKEPVITQREVQSVISYEGRNSTTEDVDAASSPKIIPEHESEPGSYEDIPENKEQSSRKESSPAVKSLMIRARADMAIGNEQSAISKLERALRIESDNPDLWYLLARAHQSSSDHQQAITMAKKAINYAGSNDEMVAKSWQLIQKSGEASGDSMVVKEAINYSKVNP